MIRVLFVCHGNICRSPMAEFVMKKLVSDAGVADRFLIESAATSSEEIGNPVYPPARAKLAEHGISCRGKTARRVTPEDYLRYDFLIGMDSENLRNLRRLFRDDPEDKIHLLMEYTDRPGSVADPWYTDDFDASWRDIHEGCLGLLNTLIYPLRKATVSDTREVMALYRSAIGRPGVIWDENYPAEENLQADLAAHGLYVMERNGKIIGAASVLSGNDLELNDLDVWKLQSGNHREIVRITVSEKFSGHGLARDMLRRIFSELRNEGVSSIRLLAAVDNLPALATYRRLSFANRGKVTMFGHVYFAEEKAL